MPGTGNVVSRVIGVVVVLLFVATLVWAHLFEPSQHEEVDSSVCTTTAGSMASGASSGAPDNPRSCGR